MSAAPPEKNPVQKNKVVTVTYVLRKQDGQIYEYNDMGVTYLHGTDGPLFPKIEAALEGRVAGDTVSVQLSPGEGFGPHDPNLTFTDDIDNVPPEFRRLGAEVDAQNESGETLHFVVTRIADGRLTVDANHPLAGQTVDFDVTVRDVRDATPEELRAGSAVPRPIQ